MRINKKNTSHKRHRQRGSIIVETAFVLPILVMLMMGALEVSRYVLLNQKADRVRNDGCPV